MGDQDMEKIFEYLRTLKQKQSEIQDEISKLESFLETQLRNLNDNKNKKEDLRPMSLPVSSVELSLISRFCEK